MHRRLRTERAKMLRESRSRANAEDSRNPTSDWRCRGCFPLIVCPSVLGSTRLFPSVSLGSSSGPSGDSGPERGPETASICPSVVVIPFNHCVMAFAGCSPFLPPLILPCMTPSAASPLPKPSYVAVRLVRPPYPFDRPSDWEKHLKQLAHGREGQRREEEERRADFTLLLCRRRRLNIWIGGAVAAGGNYYHHHHHHRQRRRLRRERGGKAGRRRQCPKSHERPFAREASEGLLTKAAAFELAFGVTLELAVKHTKRGGRERIRKGREEEARGGS